MVRLQGKQSCVVGPIFILSLTFNILDIGKLPSGDSNGIEEGDLLYYYNLDGNHQVDHLVMYVGSGPWGDNTVIAAASTGTTVSFAPLFTSGSLVSPVRRRRAKG